MGLVMWAAAGAGAFAVARMLKSGGAVAWPVELTATILAGIAFGLLATAFDFGGWKELEWRAGAFALAGASLTLAIVRFARLAFAARERH